MDTTITDVPPDFCNLVQNCLQDGKKLTPMDTKSLLQDVFTIAVDRGLNDTEFDLLLQFFQQGDMGTNHKIRLLPNLVPTHTVPTKSMLEFMVWFIYNYKMNLSNRFSTYILQWIIGLLEHGFLNQSLIDVFYHDLYFMLRYKNLRKYACKLICRLTKPYDVTMSRVLTIKKYMYSSEGSDLTFLSAVLNVFKGFKPRLVPEDHKRVNVQSVMATLPQNTDSIIKCLKKKQHSTLVTRHLGIIGEFARPIPPKPTIETHQLSLLVPFPSYNVEGLDKMVACYPQSIEETFRRFRHVPIPQNIMSLLRDNTGFFLIMFSSIEVQRRFSRILLDSLEGVLIRRDVKAPDHDVEFLLSQTYKLQMFMQQALPCVSLFLSGYFLTWDGLDHRSQVLKLVEWSTFKSFRELYAHVLSPLYMLFISCDTTMKQQILQTATNLIRNMYLSDVERVAQNLPHPFMKTAPAWTQEPVEMLEPLVKWVEGLIQLSFQLQPVHSSLLTQCVHFYDMMNILESRLTVPMWTVVCCPVVYHSLLNMTPNALNQVCALLHRYHSSFLPTLRETSPEFYNSCLDKIHLTTRYIKELINLLWDGQALSKKEEGVLLKEIPQKALQKYCEQMDVDQLFDIKHNISFFPYVVKVKEDGGKHSLQTKEDYLAMLEFYTPDIAKFIQYFSDSFQPQ